VMFDLISGEDRLPVSGSPPTCCTGSQAKVHRGDLSSNRDARPIRPCRGSAFLTGNRSNGEAITISQPSAVQLQFGSRANQGELTQRPAHSELIPDSPGETCGIHQPESTSGFQTHQFILVLAINAHRRYDHTPPSFDPFGSGLGAGKAIVL
jgi:hypothetical protein